MPDSLRVIVVDDHEMVLQGLLAALEAEPDIEVAGAFSSVDAFRDAIGGLTADVVVTDWQLDDGTGADVATAARSLPDVAVIIISGFEDERTVTAAIEAGCSGFVSKGVGVTELTRAIRSVAAGAAVFPAEMLVRAVKREAPDHETLTKREIEVLECLASAMTVEQIANDLYLSVHTVRNHVRSILTKLHARSQLEAVVEGVRSGLVRVN